MNCQFISFYFLLALSCLAFMEAMKNEDKEQRNVIKGRESERGVVTKLISSRGAQSQSSEEDGKAKKVEKPKGGTTAEKIGIGSKLIRTFTAVMAMTSGASHVVALDNVGNSSSGSTLAVPQQAHRFYEVPAHPAYDNPVNNPLYDFEHESHRGNMATPAENIENLTETDYEQISEKENQPSPERENERRIDPSNEKETNQQMHPANGVHLEQPLLMSGSTWAGDMGERGFGQQNEYETHKNGINITLESLAETELDGSMGDELSEFYEEIPFKKQGKCRERGLAELMMGAGKGTKDFRLGNEKEKSEEKENVIHPANGVQLEQPLLMSGSTWAGDMEMGENGFGVVGHGTKHPNDDGTKKNRKLHEWTKGKEDGQNGENGQNEEKGELEEEVTDQQMDDQTEGEADAIKEGMSAMNIKQEEQEAKHPRDIGVAQRRSDSSGQSSISSSNHDE